MRIPESFLVPMASELITSMEEPCSIAAAVSIVDEKWTLLVLREALSGVTRFSEFLRCAGCSSVILPLRLKALMTYGIPRRVPYQKPDDHVHDAYRLTRVGVDLLPAIVALAQQGDRYLTPDDGGSMLLYDRESNTPIYIALVNVLGEPVAPKNSMRRRNLCYGRGENRITTTAGTPPANG